jgi:hypothetical protein
MRHPPVLEHIGWKKMYAPLVRGLEKVYKSPQAAKWLE